MGEWVRSESFWRDVASRTLAGLIVTSIAFVAAIGGGLIDWRSALPVVVAVLLFVVPVGFGIAIAARIGRRRRVGAFWLQGLVITTSVIVASLLVPIAFLLFP